MFLIKPILEGKMKPKFQKSVVYLVLLFLLPVNVISQVATSELSQIKNRFQTVLDSLRHCRFYFTGRHC